MELMNDISDKIAKIESRIKEDKQKVYKLRAQEREKVRKARTRQLIEIGGLAEIAGLTETDRGALLGLFLENRERLKDEMTFRNLKRLGDAFFLSFL